MPFWADGQVIEVEAREGQPLRFRHAMDEHQVDQVSVHWRVHTAWWTETEIWRDYWEVTTDTHLLAVLYRNMLTEEWRLERVYE